MGMKIERTEEGAMALSATAQKQLVFNPDGSVSAPKQAKNLSDATPESLVTKQMIENSTDSMFAIGMWMGASNKIPAGKFALNGQYVTELQVPGLQAAIKATGQPYVTAAEWTASPATHCGKFGLADGYTILPDWMGATPGTMGKLYFAGGIGALRGTVVADQNKLHTHAATIASNGAHTHPITATAESSGAHTHNMKASTWGSSGSGTHQGDGSGGLTPVTTSNGAHTHNVTGTAASAGAHTHAVDIAADGGEELRPKTVYGTWVISLYGSFTGLLEYDVAAHAAALSAQLARIVTLESLSIGAAKQDVLANRGFTTTYTNTSSTKARRCYLSMTAAAGGFAVANVDGDDVATIGRQTAGSCGMTFDVPPLKTYSVTATGMTLTKWKEQ